MPSFIKHQALFGWGWEACRDGFSSLSSLLVRSSPSLFVLSLAPSGRKAVGRRGLSSWRIQMRPGLSALCVERPSANSLSHWLFSRFLWTPSAGDLNYSFLVGVHFPPLAGCWWHSLSPGLVGHQSSSGVTYPAPPTSVTPLHREVFQAVSWPGSPLGLIFGP